MKTKLIIISMVTVIALLFSSGTAFAAAHMNISFQTSSGNSAGWVVGGQETYLSIGASSAADGFAVIYVHHTPTDLPASEPTYSVTGYGSGTPRIFVEMSDGSYMFIYPDSVYGSGNVECVTTSGDTITTYSACSSTLSGNGATVAAVYIDRKSTRLNSSHYSRSRMPSSA